MCALVYCPLFCVQLINSGMEFVVEGGVGELLEVYDIIGYEITLLCVQLVVCVIRGTPVII